MFDHIKPIDPKKERLKRRLLIGIPVALAVLGGLYYQFKNYPEERAVARFLTSLQERNYERAYELWQPNRYYTYDIFLRDWGPEGDEGIIEDFDITESRARGSGVRVDVVLNRNKRLSLWVEKSTKGLSFPP